MSVEGVAAAVAGDGDGKKQSMDVHVETFPKEGQLPNRRPQQSPPKKGKGGTPQRRSPMPPRQPRGAGPAAVAGPRPTGKVPTTATKQPPFTVDDVPAEEKSSPTPAEPAEEESATELDDEPPSAHPTPPSTSPVPATSDTETIDLPEPMVAETTGEAAADQEPQCDTGAELEEEEAARRPSSPEAVVEAEPEPEAEQQAGGDDDPAPQPEPAEPTPAPTSEPEPVELPPAPTPEPEPVEPTPAPTPEPEPVEPTPAPTPEPDREPVPEPKPAPVAPEPAPAPTSVPTPTTQRLAPRTQASPPAVDSPSRSRRSNSGRTLSALFTKSANKHIIMYINGNSNRAGRSVLYDCRKHRTFGMFLDEVTSALKPKYGAVRRVFHAETGHEVTAYDQVEAGQPYVAVGPGGFKRLNYTKIQDFKTKEQNYVAPDLSTWVRKVVMPQSNVLERLKQQQPLTIHVLPNGDESGMSQRFVFQTKELKSLETVYGRITDKFQLKLDAVTKLYSLGGKLVREISDLKDSKVYVAVDRGPLKAPPFESGPHGSLTRKPAKKVVLKKLPTFPTKKTAEASKLQEPAAASPSSKPKEDSGKKSQSKHEATAAPQREQVSPGACAVSSSDEVTLDVRTREDALALIDHLYVQLGRHNEEEQVDDILVDVQKRIRELLGVHRQEAPHTTTAFDDKVEEILTFMMQPTDTQSVPTKTPRDIKSKFGLVVEAALAGRLSHWEATPTAFVALVIVLDQFPRSMHAGTAKMYGGDELVREVVLRAVFQTGIMDEVHPVYRLFPCLALSHQEDIDMQKLCISEWARATRYFESDDPILQYGSTFRSNYEVIEHFGRFPDRNQLVKRRCTPEEVEYLGGDVDDLIAPKKKRGKRGSVKTKMGKLRVMQSSLNLDPQHEAATA